MATKQLTASILNTTTHNNGAVAATAGATYYVNSSRGNDTRRGVGLSQHYQDLLQSRSFEDIVKIIQEDKINYQVPKPKTALHYRKLFSEDPSYVIIILRDIAQTIQQRLRRDWTPEQFLSCFRAYLRTLGLPPEAYSSDEAKQSNGFASNNFDIQITTRVCGDAISNHVMPVLHVRYICNAPMNLVIMVHTNRAGPTSTFDAASGGDLDMFQDLFSSMSQLSSMNKDASAAASASSVPLFGFVAIFDTELNRMNGGQVRTFATRLNETRTDMYTMFDGMSDDPRVRHHLELSSTEEEKNAQKQFAEFAQQEKEEKKRFYEENVRKNILQHNILISHIGMSVQRILNEQEEQWNTHLDEQIKFLRQEVQRRKQEYEEHQRKQQQFARKRPLMPPPTLSTNAAGGPNPPGLNAPGPNPNHMPPPHQRMMGAPPPHLRR